MKKSYVDRGRFWAVVYGKFLYERIGRRIEM